MSQLYRWFCSHMTRRWELGALEAQTDALLASGRLGYIPWASPENDSRIESSEVDLEAFVLFHNLFEREEIARKRLYSGLREAVLCDCHSIGNGLAQLFPYSFFDS